MNNDYNILEVSTESSLSISVEQGLYDLYYRNHGIRMFSQLSNPVISDIALVELPKFSIYHHNPLSPMLFGPLENDPWFKNLGSMRFIEHVFEYDKTIGSPIRKPGNETQLISAYRRKHRTLRLLRDFFGVNRQGAMLMVYNYCLLNQLYRYRPHRYVNYFKFMNFFTVVFKTINKLCTKSERNQFLEVRLPKTILPRQLLRTLGREYTKGISNRIIKYFNDDDSFLFLHLWIWLSSDKQYSLFNLIDERYLNKVNILLSESGKYTVLNLGKLHEWKGITISDDDAIIDDDGEEPIETDNEEKVNERLQITFYRLIQMLLEYRSGTPALPTIEVPVYKEEDFTNTDNEDDDEVIDVKPVNDSDEIKHSINNDEDNESETKLDKVVKEVGKLTNPINPIKSDENGLRKGLKDISDLGEDYYDKVEDTIEYPEEEKDIEKVEVIHDPDILKENNDLISSPDYIPTKETEKTDDIMLSGVLEDSLALVEAGLMTAKQYERVKKEASEYKSKPAPFGSNETLEEFIKVPDEVVNAPKPKTIPDNKWVLDKSMLRVSTEEFKKQYIKEVYRRNVIQNILGLQKGGIIVSDIQADIISDVSGAYEEYKVQVQPIDGKKTTMTIRLPHVEEDGTWVANNIRYTLRSQRRDKPLRKVNPIRVALTTYYGKLNVEKTERKQFNLEKYYISQIQSRVIDGTVLDSAFGNVFDKSLKLPVPYSLLSKRFRHFIYKDKSNNGFVCHFDYKTRHDLLLPLRAADEVRKQEVTRLENEYKGVLFARTAEHPFVYYFLDNDNNVISSNGEPPMLFDTFLGFDNPPIEMAEIKIFGKPIPIGILLGYYLGLTPLCKLLNIPYRKVFRGQRSNLMSYEFQIKFADETWIFDKRNYKGALILNSLNLYKRYLQDYSAEQFESKDVYTAIIREAGLPSHLENEFKLMKRMFIDDISKSLLEKMKEPTEFIPLIIRAVELLTIMWSNDEINMDDMIIAGHQRLAGQVYTELVRNLKNANNNQALSARKRFDLPPDHMLQVIQKDSAVMLVDDINPIQNLKEHDSVTFSGHGGRTDRTMVARTRAYHKSDIGMISEATVDNSSVGVNTFLSGSPNFTSLYGDSERLENPDISASRIVSSPMLLSVGLDTDDPKRQAFKSIQDSHTVAIKGSLPSPVRTGYESIISHRVDKKFAFPAKEDGAIIEKSDKHIRLKYHESGKEESVELGKIYGVSAGHIIANKLISEYIVGQEFKAFDVIAYNPAYFTRDIFNKSQVIFKYSAPIRTAFMESNDTEEDSNAISQRLNEVFETNTTEVRYLVVPFEDKIENLRKVGDVVEADSILCTIVNAVFSDNNMFGEDSLLTLEQLSQSSPRVRHAGKITKIEVMYYGNIEEATMSDSVRRIINQYDNERKLLSKKMKDGRVDNGRLLKPIRIDGNPIPNNHVAIKFYIENTDGVTVGDK